jgi:hypothetical protein
MTTQNTSKIAWRKWSKAVPIFYVSNLPGDGGKDWGYHTDPAKALPLSPYWQVRFAANCRACGSEAFFQSQANF